MRPARRLPAIALAIALRVHAQSGTLDHAGGVVALATLIPFGRC